MSAVVIVLIILGLIFIFASFAFSTKLDKEGESEDSEVSIKLPKKLTDEQKQSWTDACDAWADEESSLMAEWEKYKKENE